MNSTSRWEDIQRRAKAFLSQPSLKYHYLNPLVLPNKGGIYMIYLLSESMEEIPLYINFTNDLRYEIITKQWAYKIVNPSSDIIENCYLRFLIELDVKEQMALTVAVSLMLKPTYCNN